MPINPMERRRLELDRFKEQEATRRHVLEQMTAIELTVAKTLAALASGGILATLAMIQALIGHGVPVQPLKWPATIALFWFALAVFFAMVSPLMLRKIACSRARS
ncbi:hypothetical protein BH09PSE6_BH09PSE6_13760 [soil metagenome]